MKMPKFFWKILGGIFLVWGLLYEGLLIHHYGWDQGLYLWLCNLALVLTGFAFLFESKTFAIALLSPLLFTQGVWIFDGAARAFLGHDFLGLTEALYQPGISHFEFLLALHHFFVLPALLLSAFLLENKKGHPGRVIFLLAAVILPLSYFLFPAEQNINCMHAPCVPDLEHLKGKQYAILFGSLSTLLSLGIARLFNRGLGTRVLSGKNQRTAFWLFIGVLFLSLLLSALSYHQKKKIPAFRCEGPWENNEIKIQCRFTTEYIQNWMVLQYRMENKTNRLKECSSFIEANGKKELLQDGLFIEPRASTDISILIHYPATESAVQLSATCLP